MTINYCDKEDRYWIKDGDQTLTFASSLDAKDALREMEVRQAVNAEVVLIANWFRQIGMAQAAIAVEKGEYRNG